MFWGEVFKIFLFITKGREEMALSSPSLGYFEETLTKCIIKGADDREKGVRVT